MPGIRGRAPFEELRLERNLIVARSCCLRADSEGLGRIHNHASEPQKAPAASRSRFGNATARESAQKQED
jgi:hypothetical protein